YQDAGLALFGVREARPHAAGKTLAPGDALDGRTHDRHVPRCKIEHAFDRACVPGRAFALHPVTEALQHGLGIEGKIGWVHCGRSRFLIACSSADRYERERRSNCKVKTRCGMMPMPGMPRPAGRRSVRPRRSE